MPVCVGGEIDQPLDHIGGFRTAVAAIGPHRVGVRVHGRDIGMDGGRAIDPGERAQIVEEVRRAGLQVSAHVGDGLHPHAEERAVLVERKLGVGDVVARLGVAEKSLRSRALPFDRAAGELRCEQHQRRLVEDRRFHAEAAADIAGDDMDPALRDLEHLLREIRAERVHALRLGVERVVAAGRVVVADATARLHGHGGDAAYLETMADDVVRARERRVRGRLVAREVNETDVVRAIFPYARRAGRRGVGGRRDARQRLVIDRDQLGGVGGLRIGFGNDERDVIADPAHMVLRQSRIRRTIHRAAVAALLTAGDRQIPPSGTLPVRARQDEQHAGRRHGARNVDRARILACA